MNIFNKDFRFIITESVESYINHLASICHDDFFYIAELRSLLGKLIRESDWSYILFDSPKKSFAGKIKILNSSSSEFPRKSQWKLFQNGILKKISLFSSQKTNLMELLLEIQTKSENVFALYLNCNEFLEIEAEHAASSTLKKLGAIASSQSFRKRTMPSILMLDSVSFCKENNLNNPGLSVKLEKIINTLIVEAYGLSPEFIKFSKAQIDQNIVPEANRIKLEIGRESISFLSEVLTEYTQLIESNSSADQDLVKIEKIKRLVDIFSKGIK
ncbi:MAG TPA: hypothetical protein DD381_06410 [Lentisphaeria bacterium]|nr:MAG: hypothetical protein A2X47_13370 [Lentisphaerae bacterium GWF2_38_69]HBM15958.1 hypothetical protein [Lentisphaeria bacterium]